MPIVGDDSLTIMERMKLEESELDRSSGEI